MLLFRCSCVLCLVLVTSIAIAQDSGKTLRRYLEFAKLERLQLRQMEIEYAKEIDDDQRRRLANELSIKYRDHLFSTTNLSDIDSTIDRAESLVLDFPERDFSDLVLAINQAKYTVAERAVRDWLNAVPERTKDIDVRQRLRSLEKELNRLLKVEQTKRRDAIALTPIDPFGSGDDRAKQINRVEARLLHLRYLFAWTSYFRAITSGTIDQQSLIRARVGFYKTLELDENRSIVGYDKKWLDFSAPTSKRALMGLAMVYTALGRNRSADFCFEQLRIALPDFDHDSLQFNSLIFARLWDNAISHAEQRANDKKELYASTYWRAVLNASLNRNIQRNRSASPVSEKFRQLGLLGLVRNFDATAIEEFSVSTKTEFSHETPLEMWVTSLLSFTESTASADIGDLAKTVSAVDAALGSLPADFDSADRFRLQYLAALTKFQNSQTEQSLTHLKEPPAVILVVQPKLAEQAAWLRCRCLIQASRKDKRRCGSALVQLNRFIAAFPRSEFFDRAQFEKSLVTNRLLPPHTAIARLSEILLAHPFFMIAQFEIFVHRHKIWQMAMKSETDSETAFAAMVTHFENFVTSTSDPELQLQAIRLLLPAMLQQGAEEADLLKIIQQAEVIIESSNQPQTVMRQQLLRSRFVVAKQFGDIKTAYQLAQQILMDSIGQKIEVEALTFIVDRAEQLNLNAQQKKSALQGILQRTGSDLDSLSKSKNARVAASRLVELLIGSRQLEQAQQLNARLLQQQPRSRAYLLNAARIATEQNEADAALNIWKRIAADANAGDAVWLEAKFSMVKIIAPRDRARAEQLLSQTVALAGELNDTWKQKFEDLAKHLTQTAKPTGNKPALAPADQDGEKER